MSSAINTRWWERKKDNEPVPEWQELIDPSTNQPYYYNTITSVVQWEKPESLLSASELQHGQNWIWVEDDEDVFIPARIKSQNQSQTLVIDQQNNQRTIQHKKGVTKPTFSTLQLSSLSRIVSDLILLDSIEAPLILHNLKKRFIDSSHIYTNIGTILIALNPYQTLPLYTKELLRMYATQRPDRNDELPPHVYQIAAESFKNLRDFGNNQSIVISGESGSGKTVTNAHIIDYLSFASNSSTNISEMVTLGQHVLESLGNAKTCRNDNSSRFGKYMQIFFKGKNCTMTSGLIRTYLLEKVRVVLQGPNERNFHCFYQLLAGLNANPTLKLQSSDTKTLKESLLLDTLNPSHFKYLKTCTYVPTIDDAKDFAQLLHAFDAINLPHESRLSLFSILTSVMLIGNLTFSQDSTDAAIIPDIAENNQILEKITTLLKLKSKDDLTKALTTKELRIKNQTTTVMKLNKIQASASRDVLSKFIYSYLFDWVVATLNKTLNSTNISVNDQRFIGCLDIFGFEIFESNSFEQLLINYTNEVFQHHFNYQIFKLEEEIYRQEKIPFEKVDFTDNQIMIDLISFKPIIRPGGSPVPQLPMGILPLLDEELLVVKSTDDTFYQKCLLSHENNKIFAKNGKVKRAFIIQHYAGLVSYDCTGFLEKNADVMTTDLVDLLMTSELDLVKEIIPATVSQQQKRSSLGLQFRQQLEELMTIIRLTTCSYVKCIKPNGDKSAMSFSSQLVHSQLLYSGIYDTTRIRKLGYPFRMTNVKFVERYSVLFDNETAPGKTVEDKCQAIVNHMKLDPTNTRLGVTTIFYRAQEHKNLELHRNIKVRLRETESDLKRLTAIDISGYGEKEKETFFFELAGTIRSADQFRFPDSPILIKARKLLDKYVEERMDGETKAKLQIALEKKDKSLLEVILPYCERNGFNTSLVRDCSILYESITDCEAALTISIAEMSQDFLQRSLEMYNGIKYIVNGTIPELVINVKALLEKIDKALSMLNSSLSSLNHEHLRKTIDYCQTFNFKDPKVAIAKKLYSKIMDIRDLLTLGKKNTDLNKMKEGLEKAHEICYDAPLVDEVKKLLKRCQRIEVSAETALTTLYYSDIMIILKAANEISYPVKANKALKKLKQLIDGPQLDYYNAQLEAAKKLGDHERAIILNMMLSIEKVQQGGANQFALHQFRNLKPSMDWAKESWWWGSEHRNQTFLSYYDSLVHSPLTLIFQNIPDPRQTELTDKVILCYENIQKVMLIRKSKQVQERIQQILLIGSDNIEIRDEIYIGIMKFLTNNTHEQQHLSIERGFELFALCLITFPPSLDLLLHVYHFLSLPQWKAFTEKFNLLFLLARINYLNAIIAPFWGSSQTLLNIPQLLNQVLPQQTFFYDQSAQQSKDQITTCDDLKIKFNDPNYDEKLSKCNAVMKKSEKLGLCSNVVSPQVKKEYDTLITSRRNGHNTRQSGVIIMKAPMNEPISTQHIARPAIIKSTATFDEPDEQSVSKKQKNSKSSTTKTKKVIVQQSSSEQEEQDESEPVRKTKKPVNKSNSNRVIIDQDDNDDNIKPKKSRPAKKQSKLMFE